jgi:hypothetical protein
MRSALIAALALVGLFPSLPAHAAPALPAPVSPQPVPAHAEPDPPAHAEPDPAAHTEPAPPARTAMFALLIGADHAVDHDLPVLHYADDDAARYHELFELLGARSALLADLDDNTRRLHPAAAQIAAAPTMAELSRAVDRLATQVAAARGSGMRTVLYFVFAGHGSVERDAGYLALADGKLSGDALARDVIERIRHDTAHVIVDACSSFYLAFGRGPGGSSRPRSGFAVGALGRLDYVGLLLSSTTTRESHEWQAWEAGVFSHEVRSGLYGAADSDGDGVVTYREIAAFVTRANQRIPSERFRPEVYFRPPRQREPLLDLQRFDAGVLAIEAARHGHYVVESELGVRVAEFHSGAGQRVRLHLPASARYLRQPEVPREYLIARGGDPHQLVPVEAPPGVTARGAENANFARIFDLPFDAAVVAGYQGGELRLVAAPDGTRLRHGIGWTAAALAAGLAATGAGFWIDALGLAAQSTDGLSQRDTARLNDRITSRNHVALAFGASAAAAATGAALLLLWPAAPATMELVPGGAALTVGGGF